MVKKVIIELDGVGPVLFERSIRAKHLNVSVRPFKGVRVAVPRKVSFSKAKKFAFSKIDWIRKHIDRLKHVEEEREAIRNETGVIEKAEAGEKLVKRLSELANRHGFNFNKVTIRNQKTRWGSCSSRNNISLNIQLVKLPDELLDYVILHELLHTRIRNHGNRFWSELDKIVENAKALASKLKSYPLGMYDFY